MEPQPNPQNPTSAGSPTRRLRAFLRFTVRHPFRVLQGVVLSLVVVVILQNIEPISIQVLFWSIPSLPTIVLILVAMLIGGAVWEIVRRLMFR